MSQPELIALKERLKNSAGRFQFIDASARPNRWHPIHLRLPLAQVWADVDDTPEARYQAWLARLREGAALILAGGEIEAIRTRVLAEQGTIEG